MLKGIDQSNTSERNHQVSQMGQIYSQSALVIAWLGEVDPGMPQERGTGGCNLTGLKLLSMDLRKPMDTIWIDHLLNKPYWKRTWVIQEFVLAHKVQLWCGPYYARWHGVKSWILHDWFDPTHYSSCPEALLSIWNSPGHKLLATRKRYWSGIAKPRLSDLMMTFCESQCREKVDKVYAFLAIAEDVKSEQTAIPVDYAKPLVHVVFDIFRLEDRRRNGKFGKDPKDVILINTILKSMDVQRGDFTTALMSRMPGLEARFLAFNITTRPLISLNIVGTVRQLDFGSRQLDPVHEMILDALATGAALQAPRNAVPIKWTCDRQKESFETTHIVLQQLLDTIKSPKSRPVAPITASLMTNTFSDTLSSRDLLVDTRETSEPKCTWKRHKKFVVKGPNSELLYGISPQTVHLDRTYLATVSLMNSSSNTMLLIEKSSCDAHDWEIFGIANIIYTTVSSSFQKQIHDLEPEIYTPMATKEISWRSVREDVSHMSYGSAPDKIWLTSVDWVDVLALHRHDVINTDCLKALLEFSSARNNTQYLQGCHMGRGDIGHIRNFGCAPKAPTAFHM